MEKQEPARDQLLVAVAILLGAGLVVVAFWLAFVPRHSRSHYVPTNIKPRTITDTKVQLSDFSLSNYGGESIRLDDEKTTGSTNVIIPSTGLLPPDQLITPGTHDLEMTDDPSKCSTAESAIAPIAS